MSLARDCLVPYIIWHEMMHALGFEHEHQRPDRDAYIRVQYSNVVPGQIANFEKLGMNEVDLYGHAYDYHSIMHYDGTAFGRFDRKSRKRLVTMIPIKKGVRLNDNTEFTMLDVEKLNRLGECMEQSDGGNGADNCKDTGSNCLVLAKRGFCDLDLYR
uniref:Metalloendopeptidase n=1 Tax=Parascaris univalens TaxID=6257 RepID=A0A915AA19_PARUN